MLTTQFRKNQRHLLHKKLASQNLVPKTIEEVHIIEQWRVSKQDIGSVDIEIGFLTERISQLEELLPTASRIEKQQLRLRLIAYVHSRRKKLDYLLSTDIDRYHKALDRLEKITRY